MGDLINKTNVSWTISEVLSTVIKKKCFIYPEAPLPIHHFIQ